MKRSFLYFAASALVLSACTSENVLEDAVLSQNAIGFENVVSKHTRADITSGTLNKFNVFGYYTTPVKEGEQDPMVAVPVFEDMTVYRLNDGTWSYFQKPVTDGSDQTENTGNEYRYWVPGAHYYFYAYSCGNVVKLSDEYGDFSMNMSGGLTPSERVLNINNYVCDASHQHDLVFASNTGATESNQYAGIVAAENGNSLVSFQFKHLLSKVQAQFTSAFPEDYEVIISDVSIENIRNVGSYNPNAGWQSVNRNGYPNVYLLKTSDKEVNPISTSRGNDAAKTNSAYVIPYAYNGSEATEGSSSTWVSLKFYINVKNKGQVVLSKQLTGKFNPVWVAGYTYTYNVEISGDAANLQAIAFTTATDDNGQTVTNWNPDETPVITIDK